MLNIYFRLYNKEIVFIFATEITNIHLDMSKDRKTALASIMHLAWQFVKRNGFTMAEALTVAWRNFKLKNAMKSGIVQFYFRKVNSEIRQAFGTLKSELLPETQGTGRKANDSVQVYFDTERQEYRSFKRCNLISIV